MNVARHHRPPTVIALADECVADVAARMRAAAAQCMPVLDASGRVLGIVTARDLGFDGTLGGHDPRMTTVGTVMRMRAPTIHEDAELEEAFDRMCAGHTQRLLVVDRDEILLGVLWLRDVTAALAAADFGDPRGAGIDPETDEGPTGRVLLRRRPADVARSADRLTASRRRAAPLCERHACRGRWCSGGDGCERGQRRPVD